MKFSSLSHHNPVHLEMGALPLPPEREQRNATQRKKKSSIPSDIFFARFAFYRIFKNENSFATAFNYLRNVLIALGIT